MRFCIVDDDPTIIQMLSNIIEDKELGRVVGRATDGQQALEVIQNCVPDIVLIDYLMPVRDGVAVQKSITAEVPGVRFVMISQVTDKAMVADAYRAGAEFFITKPINVVEVERVLHSVGEKINMERTLASIRGMLTSAPTAQPKGEQTRIGRIRQILSHLGLVGEKGSYDILNICEQVFGKGYDTVPLDMNGICDAMGENPKIVKQRIRRAAYHGLSNLANIGIEDSMHEHFLRYAGSLYDFECVKSEMDYLRGRRQEGGRVNVGKFMEGLLVQSELEL